MVRLVSVVREEIFFLYGLGLGVGSGGLNEGRGVFSERGRGRMRG